MAARIRNCACRWDRRENIGEREREYIYIYVCVCVKKGGWSNEFEGGERNPKLVVVFDFFPLFGLSFVFLPGSTSLPLRFIAIFLFSPIDIIIYHPSGTRLQRPETKVVQGA